MTHKFIPSFFPLTSSLECPSSSSHLLSDQNSRFAHVETAHDGVEQQLFQGGHCCIDFLTLFCLSNNAQQRLSDRLIGDSVRQRLWVCAPLYRCGLHIALHHCSTLNEMCNLNTCHPPRTVEQKHHQQSMTESSAHTVDGIQTPIVSQLSPCRDIF